MKEKQKLYIGVTPDNELYYIEIEPMSESHPYFAMSGTSLRLIDAERAEEEVREELEDGEFWRASVAEKNTTLGLDEWVEQAFGIDGWENSRDIDWDIGELEVGGKSHYFENSAGGQHVERNIKKLFIARSLYETLLTMWDANHLKKYNGKLPTIPAQDEKEIAREAAEFIKANEE